MNVQSASEFNCCVERTENHQLHTSAHITQDQPCCLQTKRQWSLFSSHIGYCTFNSFRLLTFYFIPSGCLLSLSLFSYLYSFLQGAYFLFLSPVIFIHSFRVLTFSFSLQLSLFIPSGCLLSLSLSSYLYSFLQGAYFLFLSSVIFHSFRVLTFSLQLSLFIPSGCLLSLSLFSYLYTCALKTQPKILSVHTYVCIYVCVDVCTYVCMYLSTCPIYADDSYIIPS